MGHVHGEIKETEMGFEIKNRVKAEQLLCTGRRGVRGWPLRDHVAAITNEKERKKRP